MGQILQFGEIHQFQEQRVHHSPAIDAQHTEDRPQEHHNHIVGKVQIVDNGEEDQGQSAPNSENGKGPQPGHYLPFIFLKRDYRESQINMGFK